MFPCSMLSMFIFMRMPVDDDSHLKCLLEMRSITCLTKCCWSKVHKIIKVSYKILPKIENRSKEEGQISPQNDALNYYTVILFLQLRTVTKKNYEWD